MDFIIDPLSTEESVANVLCTDGQKVYYENENSEIICRDMVSYEEKVFFQPSVNSGISPSVPCTTSSCILLISRTMAKRLSPNCVKKNSKSSRTL